jgi:hypothetical protein
MKNGKWKMAGDEFFEREVHLRISAFSSLNGYFDAEIRRGPQRESKRGRTWEEE